MANMNQPLQPVGISRQLEETHADFIAIRKRTEAELRRLTAIVEFSDDAIISQTPEGLILSWNPGAERTFGYAVAEAVGQSIYMLVPHQGADEFRHLLTRISKGDRIQDFKTRLVRNDGATIVVSLTLLPVKTDTGEVGGVWAMARDITAKDRLEDQLRLQAQVLANLAEGVALVRARDAVIVYATERFEAIFGYDPGELMGKPLAVLNAAGDHSPEETADLIIHSLKEYGIWRGEIRNIRKDGVVFWTYGNISTFEHPEHGTVWVNAQSDIDARKQLEREVLEIATTEQRRIGQELHDSTSQELTALGLLAETLTETLAGRSAAETPIAVKMVTGLKRTLAQVRAISRGLIPVEVDAQGLDAALADLAARTSELQGITCTFSSKQPVQVEDNAKATHLFYIAQETVTNALRHGRAAHITIEVEEDERALTLRIQDDGIGFAEKPVEVKGMGIKIMRYRAGLINARLTLNPVEPTGTMMTCTVSKGFTHDGTPEERGEPSHQGPDR